MRNNSFTPPYPHQHQQPNAYTGNPHVIKRIYRVNDKRKTPEKASKVKASKKVG